MTITIISFRWRDEIHRALADIGIWADDVQSDHLVYEEDRADIVREIAARESHGQAVIREEKATR